MIREGMERPMGDSRHGKSDSNPRTELLLHMYAEMWENINRHVSVLWQAVGILASGGLAALAFAGTTANPNSGAVDLASTLAVLTASWVAAHAFDTSEWFNRNIQVIANIEKALLDEGDDGRIHPYIGFERPNKMIPHLRIQVFFAGSVALAVLIVHWAARDLRIGWGTVDPSGATPYAAALVGGFFVWRARSRAKRGLKKFQCKLKKNEKRHSP